jgi:polar amino acid transport system substrate-binding protein
MTTSPHTTTFVRAGLQWLSAAALSLTALAAGAQPAAAPGAGFADPQGAPRLEVAAETSPARPAPSVDTLATVRNRGTLRVGVAVNEPMVMHDRQGALVGYSIDLARRLADDLGVTGRVRRDLVVADRARAARAPFRRHLVGPVGDAAAGAGGELHRRGGLAGHPPGVRAVGRGHAARWPTSTAPAPASWSTPARSRNRSRRGCSRAPRWSRSVAIRPPGAGAGRAGARGAGAHRRAPAAAARGARQVVPAAGQPLSQSITAMAIRKGDADFLSYLNTWLAVHRAEGWLDERAHHWSAANGTK